MTTFGDILKKAAEEGVSFEVLEAGDYLAKIIESEYKLSNGGKPQIKTRWEVVQGPKAGFKGLWNYFTLTVDNPNAMAIFYRQMTALGITNEFMTTLAQATPEQAMKQIALALDGRQARVKVVIDKEYNNNKIERINPLPPEFAATQSSAVGAPFPGVSVPAAPVAAAQAPSPAPVAASSESTAPVAETPASALPVAPF